MALTSDMHSLYANKVLLIISMACMFSSASLLGQSDDIFFTDTIDGKVFRITNEEVEPLEDNLELPAMPIAAALLPMSNCLLPVPLNNWTQGGNPSDGNWNVSNDNFSVLQTINGGPTFWISDIDYCNTSLRGSFRVETRSDNDFAGFVFGYSGDDDYLIFDWKQSSQTFRGVTGAEGFRLGRVQGGVPTFTELWGFTGSNITVLDDFLNNTAGWEDLTLYEFRFEYTSNRIQIFVQGGSAYPTETQIIDVMPDPVLDPNGFPCGRFGFYNLSQSRVRYSGFSEEFFTGIQVGRISCNGADDGSLTAQPNLNFSGAFDYSWENLAAPGIEISDQPTISGLSPGTYTLMVTVQDTCMAFDTVLLTEPDPLSFSVSVMDDDCETGSGSIDFQNVTGGTPPYEFSIGGAFTTAEPINGLSPGNYMATVRDLNGCIDVINVSLQGDTIDPMITCPGNISANNDPGSCGAFVIVPAPVVSDDCAVAVVTNDFNGTSNASGQYDAGTTTVTFTVTDINGNSAMCSFDVTVNDTQGPILICPPGATSACPSDLDGVPADLAAFFMQGGETSDNCAIDSASFSVIETEISNTCPIMIERTFMISDTAGNTTSCTQMLISEDQIAPSFTAPADTSIDCSLYRPDSVIYVTNFSSNPFAGGMPDWDSLNGSCNFPTIDYVGGTGVIRFDQPGSGTCEASIARSFNLTGFTSYQFNLAISQNPSASYEGSGDGINDRDSVIIEVSENGSAGPFTTIFTDPEVWLANGLNEMQAGIDGNGVATTYQSPILNLSGANITDLNIRISFVFGNGGLEYYDVHDFFLRGVVNLGDVTDELDNCVTREAFHTDIISELPGCPDGNPIQRIWQLADDCGNTFIDTQRITLIDTTPPVIIQPAQNQTIPLCGVPEDSTVFRDWVDSMGGAVAIDDCSEVLWTSNITDILGCADNPGASRIIVTFIAVDECNNRDSTTAEFFATDMTPPMITVPADTLTVECDGSGNQQQLQDFIDSIGGAEAIDNCGEVAWFNDFLGYDFDCGASDTLRILFVAVDPCANKDTTVGLFIIEDSLRPSFDRTPSDTVVECDGAGNVFTLNSWRNNYAGAEVSDVCGNVTLDTFLESAIPACAGDTLRYGFIAIDDCGLRDTSYANFIFMDTTAPTFVVPPGLTVSCDNVFATGEPSNVSDNCGLLDTIFSDDTLRICAGIFEITRTWRITDVCLNFSEQAQIIRVIDTLPPSFVLPNDTTINCEVSADTMFMGVPSMLQDNCSPSASLRLTFLDDSTKTNNGTCSDFNYEIFRTWILEDDCGNRTTNVQTITVQDTTPPTFTVPMDTTFACEDSTFFDAPIGALDVLDEMDNCSIGLEASFEDSVMDEDSCIGESRIQRTWTLTDICGNTSSAVQMIERIDTIAPTFTVPPDTTLDCILLLDSLEITGDVEDEMDNCDILSGMNATFVDEVVSQNCPNEIVIRRIWSLMDDCGNMSTDTQSIVVIDTFSPTFTVPADIEINCTIDSIPSITGEVADLMDSCGVILSIAFTDLVVSGTCELVDTIIRTWTATDACGNMSQQIQRITRRCDLEVEAGIDVTLCSNGQVNLSTIGAALNSPTMVTGTWSTSGSGIFQPDATFANATTYIPSQFDIDQRTIQLSLMTNLDTSCGIFNDSLSVNFLLVNCGQFPWNGN